MRKRWARESIVYLIARAQRWWYRSDRRGRISVPVNIISRLANQITSTTWMDGGVGGVRRLRTTLERELWPPRRHPPTGGARAIAPVRRRHVSWREQSMPPSEKPRRPAACRSERSPSVRSGGVIGRETDGQGVASVDARSAAHVAFALGSPVRRDDEDSMTRARGRPSPPRGDIFWLIFSRPRSPSSMRIDLCV
jgi:hypothetical protein